MKITIVSNYINHHQIPLSNALYQTCGETYHFIQTEPMEEERIRMGWGKMVSECPYLLCYYEEEEKCRRIIRESDIVIFGGVEDESYIEERLRQGKIVIRSSERLYKEGQWKAISPRGLIKKYHDHTRYRKSPVYLLCNGGYVASDFHIVRAYPGKMFKWGYFPATHHYDMDVLMSGKQKAVTEIVWAGRFMKEKRPEYAVRLMQGFKKDGIKAHLTMVGSGELEAQLKAYVQENKLWDMVTMTGFQSPETVRTYMEAANICIATSTYWEGWGAVVNEAMNSGCAVVASHAMGAVPYLIRHEENGLVYRDGDFSEFYMDMKNLTADRKKQVNMGRAAYETITGVWNAENAAHQLVGLCKQMVQGQEIKFEPSGPISKAPVVAPGRMCTYLKKHKM